jgi:hypothetical protein
MKMLVTHKHKLSPQYFNPYYSSSQLLFQFVLSEFILAYREIQLINKITGDKTEQPQTSQTSQTSQTLHTLAHHVSLLAGSTQQHMRMLSWNDDGFLTKMKNYCALLCHHDNNEVHDLYRMYQESNQAWLLSLRVLDVVRTMLQQPPTEKAHDPSLFIPTLKKLTNCLKRFSRLVMRAVLPFSQDENVVFFILRNKEQLDALYKPKFTKDLIKKMFSKGIQEASQFLLERYTIRGFNNLIPLINRKFEELEA